VLKSVGLGTWVFFFALVLGMLAVDLLSGRSRRASTFRGALMWSGLWITLGVSFGLWVGWEFGREAAVQYYAAYLLEKALSVDNVFVFLVIFSELHIPAQHQPRVLLFGVLGALVLRALMIGAGVYLLGRFHWIVYPFAGLLLVAAARLLFAEEKQREIVAESCDVCNSWVAKLIRVTPSLGGGHFFTRSAGRLAATPLLVALLIVETSDLVFALDSIPAVLAVTRVPFLVYSSNVFAMLGLRSLYFVLGGLIERVRFLRAGLALILTFVAAKMLLEGFVEIGAGISVAVIATVLSTTVLASLLAPAKPPAPASAGEEAGA
jgi:tellurite resistance protein TerC